jgi:hypothetical protein
MTLSIRKFLTALLAVFTLGLPLARAASTIPYAESFESLTTTNINLVTNWSSDTNSDLSTVISSNITSQIPANCGAPLPDQTHSQILKLNTEGSTLTNDFGATNINGQTIYLDTLIQFVPCDTTPDRLTSASGIKAAVYMNADSNLVIHHGMINTANGQFAGTTNNITTAILNPADWYRVTIVFDATYTPVADISPIEMFQVRTNGIVIVSTNAYDDNWKALRDAAKVTGIFPTPSTTGTWFRSAVTQGVSSRKLQGVGLLGTGYLDDLVVTNGEVSYQSLSGPSSYLITVVTGSGGNSKTGGVNLATTLASFLIAAHGSTSIVYRADDWYRIASLTSNDAPVTAATGARAYTQDLVNVTADISNNVAFAQVNPGVVDAALTNILVTWLINRGYAEGAAYNNTPLSAYELYLMNANPFVAQTNNFRITNIATTSRTNIEVTVGLQINSVNHTNITGYLKLTGKTNLAETSWSQVAQTTAMTGDVFTNNGTYTYSFVDTLSNRFYKAVIEP